MNFFKYQNFIGQSSNVSPQFGHDYRYNLDPRSYCISNELQSIYGSSNDELWIDSWLTQNNLCNGGQQYRGAVKKNTITLHQSKEKLQNCLAMLDKLRGLEREMTEAVGTTGTNEWDVKMKEIELLKQDYSRQIATLSDPQTITYLKWLVDKRKKKRRNGRKKRDRTRRIEREALEERRKLHSEIDLWLRGMKEEAEAAKAEETAKRDADCVVGEVNKKRADARRQLSLISALVKLRSVREAMASQRSEKPQLEDRRAFNATTEKLIEMWENCVRTYSLEERALRSELQKTADEGDDGEAADSRLSEEWQGVVFGDGSGERDGAAYWAMTASERDMETFIAVRRSWDTFLVPGGDHRGSKMPIGWAVPDKRANPAWTKFLNS